MKYLSYLKWDNILKTPDRILFRKYIYERKKCLPLALGGINIKPALFL